MYDLQKERENVTDDREIDVDRFVCFFLPVSILSILSTFLYYFLLLKPVGFHSVLTNLRHCQEQKLI